MADSGAEPERVEAEIRAQLETLRTAPPVVVEVRRFDETGRPRPNSPPEGEGTASDSLFARLLPGLIVMFVMFSVTLASQAMVEERRTGTLERLMTTRLGVNQLFTGKFLSGVSRAMFQTLVMLSLAFVVFRPGGALTFGGAAGLCATGGGGVHRGGAGHRSSGADEESGGLGRSVFHAADGGVQRHVFRGN